MIVFLLNLAFYYVIGEVIVAVVPGLEQKKHDLIERIKNSIKGV